MTTRWSEWRTRVELFLYKHPIVTVFILLVVSALVSGGRSYVGAAIWLVTSGIVLVLSYTTLREKYPDEPRGKTLWQRFRGLWR